MQHPRENLTWSKGGTIEIQVLGAVRAVHSGRTLDLGGPRQRRLLAALVLADGAPASVDRLVEAVFGEDASPSASDTLRSYVTRLRRALAPAETDVVVREGLGYRLVFDHSTVDAARFGNQVAAGVRALDRGEPREAVGALHTALDLWRGDAYADLADETWVAPEARRLNEERRAAQELLAEALTAAGSSYDAVAVLRALLGADPYREGAVERLMLALYRSGRPADALATYREFADRVAHDLGIDPGPALQRVHERVLARDPGLDAVGSAPSLRGYELRERLGRGRQGMVWSARMPGVDREYAIRVYDADVADAPSMVSSFDADVRLLVTMDEPALLPVYDGWREPGSAALVMRRMSGTLADRIASGSLSVDEGSEVVQRVGHALVALERRGRSHGRVEPSSVLLDEVGRAYLSEPVLGHAGPRPSAGPADPTPDAGDAADFVRLAQACMPGRPTGWWDGLDPDALGTVALVTEVLARLEAPSLPPENPYVGLRPFEAADADRYFGREHVVADLVNRVTADPVVLLVGGSGSGKSSIVRAGLVPHLRRLDPPWTPTVMVPGSRPMQHLAQALQRVRTTDALHTTRTAEVGLGLAEAAQRASGRLLLVVDQLEELFTVSDPDERERFLAVLAQCAHGLAGDMRVVATVRADYFDQPLDHPVFGTIAARAALAVPPMSAADLEQTVLGPAAGRLRVDDGLATELVSAVVGQPGALPALQFTLRELADRGGVALRRDDLGHLGGVDGAIAHRAEQMYAALGPSEQQTLRQALQRLVVVDEAGEPSRRTVPRADLAALASGADTLVEDWVEGRLLATGRRPDTREPTVTLAHEAVLTRWPRLRDWVDEDRERLLALARLTQAAQEWADLGRDPAALPRGGRLEQAETLTRATVAPPLVQEYVADAQALRTEEQHQAAGAAMAEKRTSRRLRRQRWMLAVALVVAIVVGWVAIDQRGAAVAAAEEQSRRADAGASSLVAASNEALRSDWARALLLAVEARRVNPSPDTERHLLATLIQARPVPTTVWSSEQSLRSVVVDPKTTWAAVQWVGGPLDVIDLDQGRRVRGAQARGEAGFDLRDETLVFGDRTGKGGQVRVLDDTGDRVVATLPSGVEVTDVEISPNGQQVAVADSSGLVRLLAMGSWQRAGSLAGTSASPIQQIAWDDSTRSLHAFDEAGTYLAWDLDSVSAEPDHAPPTATRAASARPALGAAEEPTAVNMAVVDMQFIPGESYISVISERDGHFWVDTAAVELFDLIGFRGGRGRALGGAVTPDGGHVFVTGSSMQVFRPDSEGLPFRGIDVDWNAVDVDVRADGTVVTVGSDGRVTTWRVPGEADFAGTSRTPPLDDSAGVVVAPDGRLLLRWADAEAQLLDATTLAPTATLDIAKRGALVLGAAFVPGSDRLVAHVCSWIPERAWEPCDSVLTSYASDGTIITGPVDAGPARPSQGATIVAATGLVATVDATATVTLRDSRTLEPTERLRAPDAPDEPDSSSLSLSPSGRMLTVSTLRPQSMAAWRLGSEADLLVADTAGPAGVEAFSDYPTAYGALSLTDDAVLAAGHDAFRTYGADGGEPIAVYPDPFEQGDILASDVLQQAAQSRGTDGITASRSATSDSSLLLTGLPGSYWLWDPNRPLVLAGPMGVDGALLDPTGDRLFLWRDDGSAFVLSLRPEDLVAAACKAAGRALTQQEWSRSIGAGEPYEPACPG